jgi:hypothetical protein
MIQKLIKLFLIWLSLQIFLPAQLVLADTGPKPSMDFAFKQELPGEQVTITSGIMYECQNSDCSDASALEELGPQRFACESNSCSAVAYGFRPYHRLEIQFSDGQTRQSNIFETAGFDSTYTVTIRPQDLLVEAQFSLGVFPPIATTLIACICVLMVLSLFAGLIIFMRRRSPKN